MDEAGRLRVLVVDDEVQFHRLYREYLQKEFDLEIVATLSEAKTAIVHKQIDIVVADYKLNRGEVILENTGVVLLEEVSQAFPHIVRILMTGQMEDLDRIAMEGINRGKITRLVTREQGFDLLVESVREAARHVLLEREHQQFIQELEKQVGQRTKDLEKANLELEHQNKLLQELALTDPLTSLPNRRAMDRIAEREFRRRERYTNDIAIGMIDADHFKKINEEHLLPGGDHALIQLAQCISSAIRNVDFAGRVGGEEFLIIAPETDYAGAKTLAERIRSAVENLKIEFQGKAIKLTVSVGMVVARRGSPFTYEELRLQASEALARAKLLGRNICIVEKMPNGEPQRIAK